MMIPHVITGRRAFAGYTVKATATGGRVGAYISIYGIQDLQGDVIKAGAFAASIKANACKIRVFAQGDVTEVIGQCEKLQEHSRAQLPAALLKNWPGATGGLYAETKFNLAVQRGAEMFALYRDGDMGEWAIQFDIIDADKNRNGKGRHIKKAALWGYGPVTWGANPATQTVIVKRLVQGENARARLLRRVYQTQIAMVEVEARQRLLRRYYQICGR